MKYKEILTDTVLKNRIFLDSKNDIEIINSDFFVYKNSKFFSTIGEIEWNWIYVHDLLREYVESNLNQLQF